MENTETNDLNQITPTILPSKQPWYKNKRKLLFAIIGGVLLLGIIIVVIVVLTNKKKCDSTKQNCEKPIPPYNDCEWDILQCPPPPPPPPPYPPPYKEIEVLVYEDSTTKISTIVYNEETSFGRRLNEKSVKTTSTGKYLLNVYKVDNSSVNVVYYAYAVLLNLENDKSGKNTKVGGSDVRNSNGDFPFIKFNFDSTGEIKELKVPEDYDKTLTAYIYEFIEKVVPQVSKKLYGEDKNRQYEEDGENTNLLKKDLKEIEDFEGSKQERNIKATVKDGKVKKVTTNTKNEFNQKKEYKMSTADNNFTAELTGPNKYVTRESPIKSYDEYLESTLNLESSEVDQTLTKKIDDYVNSKKDNLKDYEKEKRRLELKEYNSKLLSKNQLRNLDVITTEPWREPFTFNYPLFNIDFLGAEIGLIAEVAFKPIIGQFEVQIYYNKNGKLESIGGKRIYTNFDEIINAVDEVIDKLRILIEGNIILEIKGIYDEYVGHINTNLELLFDKIENVPDFSDVFQQPLEELFLEIRNASAIGYNKVINNLTNTINQFNQIQNEIDAKTEPNLKKLFDETNNIESFLLTHVRDAFDIYDAAKVYYPGIVDAINTRLNILKQNKTENKFNFDITTFYDIKDIYNKVLNILSNLNQRILDAISVERINFVNQVNEQFDLILNEPLKNVEIISYNARNNASIIDAFNIYYGNAQGETKRQLLINNINSLRVKINDMLTSIYNNIQETYNKNFLNSETYKRIKTNLETYTNEIKNNQTSLMQFLGNYIHYDLNFDLYVEDVRVLLDVNYRASKSRESNYNKIYNTINGIVDSYLTQSKLNSINQNLNSYLDKIIKAVQNFNYGYALSNITLLSDAIEQVIKDNLGKKVYDAVVSRYTNKTTLDNMLKDYYSNVYTAYLEFNTTFFTNHFLAHANKYVSKPEEMITKFNRILKTQQEENETQVDNINTLIVNSINYAIESSYYTIYQLVVKLKEEFMTRAPKNVYGSTGNYRAKYEEVLRKLDDLLNLFLNNNGEMNITYKYVKSKLDEFSLNKTIHSEEYKIYLMLYTISDELENNSLRYICNGNTIILCNNKSISQAISAIDQFNYQMAKLRDAITQLKNLIPIVETMMDDTLLELDPLKYLELYKKQTYKDFQIVAEFSIYLDAIREETDTYMDAFVNQIKLDIINAFETNININGIEEAIQNLALKVFVNPEDLEEKLKLYVNAMCGPINKIIGNFTEEIKYYTFEKHSLDLTAYQNSYNNLVSELNEYYESEENQFLKDLKLKDITYINLMTEFYSIIDSGYENLKEIVKSIGSFEFQFLDHNYTFTKLVEEALNDKRDQLQDDITDLVNYHYNDYLNRLKGTIRAGIREQYNEILKALDYQFNSTFVELERYKGQYIVTEISVYSQIKSIFEDFFVKVNEIYSPDELNKELLDAQTKELNNNGINIECQFDNTMAKLNYHIQEFLEAAQKRFEDEKLEFLSGVEPGFINGFIRTVNDFLLKDGINALNNLFNSDYESTIKHEFKYLIEETTSIKEYMEVLINSLDSKSISKRLADSLKVIF